VAPRREVRLTTFGRQEQPAPVPVSRSQDGVPPARTVTEVVAAVVRAIGADPTLAAVWVKGEVSGFKRASSGHWYFDLKDEGALLNAAMFRGANQRVRFEPQDGMEVLVHGKVSVYPGRSAVQVVVDEMRPVGMGELALRFEQTRRRLEAEGLFDPRRRRPIPEYPRRVGIVTSLQAAALRDLVRVATERHPGIQLLVCAARVQGEGAAEEVARAIARLNADATCDVLIVGRGGGSVEDLWAFNEEAVVRAVAASAIPVVSAVGHESDVTLCDLAADLRAATPSNAAERVVPDAEATLDLLDERENRALAALDRLVPDLRQRVDELAERAGDAMRRGQQRERDLLAGQAARLHALSPLAVLARGFAVARKDGRLLRSAADAPPGTPLEVVLHDGALDATVTATRTKDE
jgi:exodeoxyribonuclease VII large subunit